MTMFTVSWLSSVSLALRRLSLAGRTKRLGRAGPPSAERSAGMNIVAQGAFAGEHVAEATAVRRKTEGACGVPWRIQIDQQDPAAAFLQALRQTAGQGHGRRCLGHTLPCDFQL